MALLPEPFIQQVLQATDIVELIGQFVALKQKGREFVGLCPFHADRNPSMNVAPAKQIYKCFVCGAGGNAIQFVMNYDKLSFPEAVRMLADRANIPVPEAAEAPTDRGGLSKRDLVEVTEWAAGFFQRMLRGPLGASALDYARGRGLTDASIERFGLGFAPDSWDSLIIAGRRDGFREERLVAAGLARRRDNSSGCYDYFRNRLVFPIHDLTGKVVAFGGRALAADERAKYLNSPDSVLFDKSNLAYGLTFAREGVVQSGTVVVSEGYLDVLLPLQEGVKNIVATLGTALTDRHVRLLSRYAKEVVLVFDADAAGQAAAERALQLFLEQRVHVRVASIPAGKDPADFVLAESGEAFNELVAAAPDALQYVWDRRHEAWVAAGGNPSQRQRLVEEFLTLIANSAAWGAIDHARQQNLAQHIGHVLNMSAIDLQQEMRRLSRQTRAAIPRQDAPQPQAQPKSSAPVGNPERHVLEVLLDEPDHFDDAAEKIDPHNFRDRMLHTIAERVWSLGMDGKLSLEALLSEEDMAGFAPVLTDLALTSHRRGNQTTTLHDAVAAILARQDQAELTDIKQRLNDTDSLRQLQDRLSEAHRRGGHGARRPNIQA